MIEIEKIKKKGGRPVKDKLFQRERGKSKLASITIPIVYGKDENGSIFDDLNEIKVVRKPVNGKGMNISIEIFELKDEDAYYKFCGNDPDEESTQKFIEKYPERAENMHLRITFSDDIMIFNDSEFIGKTGLEIMQLETKYKDDMKMLFRIEKIRKMMIASGNERYYPRTEM